MSDFPELDAAMRSVDTCYKERGIFQERFGFGHKPAIVLILGYPATKFLKAVRRPFLMVRGLDGR